MKVFFMSSVASVNTPSPLPILSDILNISDLSTCFPHTHLFHRVNITRVNLSSSPFTVPNFPHVSRLTCQHPSTGVETSRLASARQSGRTPEIDTLMNLTFHSRLLAELRTSREYLDSGCPCLAQEEFLFSCLMGKHKDFSAADRRLPSVDLNCKLNWQALF